MNRRRVFTPEFKLQVVLDVLSGRKSNAEVCREHELAPAVDQIGHFLEDVYMHKRIHSSLGYLTPAEFEQQWVRSASPEVVS